MLPDAANSWPRVCEFIAEMLGLQFPPARQVDLQRGLKKAANELGYEDLAAFTTKLLSQQPPRRHLDVLASHLTIGETYFARDKRTFAVLANRVLPELMAARGHSRRLRIWSAGCCTGEEPYSLAILLHQLIPGLAEWDVTIRATDVNPRFLHKAAAGVYGKWSFRDVPDGYKECYFECRRDGLFVIDPEIKKMVTFSKLNLVDQVYPEPMDLVFCRNVLMYFTPEQTLAVVEKLHRSLTEDGWLAVSPSECSQSLFSRFTTMNFPGVILYKKSVTHDPIAETRAPETSNRFLPESDGKWAPLPDVEEELPHPSPEVPIAEESPDPPAYAEMAREMANKGRLTEALTWCDGWIAADKLDSAAHYLRAVVLIELGETEQAHRSLQRAVYLDPDFVLPHFVLGNLEHGRNRLREAQKHFRNALGLLAQHRHDDLLPGSDGIAAGRLAETIRGAISRSEVR